MQFYIDHSQFTQEVRLAYSSRHFDGTFGGYYYTDRRFFTATVPTLNIGSYARRESESFAFFGQGTYHVTSRLNLTGGLRYTRDAIDFPLIATAIGAIAGTVSGTPLFTTSRNLRAGRVTWRGAADYHVTPDHMLFASVSTGYKSGAVNTALPTSLASVTQTRPEDLTSYEAGLKGSFGSFAGLHYSLTGFHTDYRNIQVGATSSSAVIVVSQLLNINSAKISGVEAELNAIPARGLSLDLGFGYIDGRYSAPSTLTIGGVELDGKRPVMTPRFSVSGSIRYEHSIGAVGKIYGGVDGHWQDRVFFGPDNLPTESQAAYATVDLRLGWKSRGDSWSIDGFVKNVTDKWYFVHMIDNGSLNTVNVTWGLPRTWGLQITRHIR